ncbi:hypothetical protein XPA_010521 [Xanthoria parietina]
MPSTRQSDDFRLYANNFLQAAWFLRSMAAFYGQEPDIEIVGAAACAQAASFLDDLRLEGHFEWFARRCNRKHHYPHQRNFIDRHGLHLHQQGLNKLHASDQGGASTILSRIRFFVQRRRPEGAYGAIADQYHSDGIFPEALILLADASEIMPTATAIKSFLQRYRYRVNESSFRAKAASMMEASPVVPHPLLELRKQARLYATYTSNCACPNDASSTTYVKTKKMGQDVEGWVYTKTLYHQICYRVH